MSPEPALGVGKSSSTGAEEQAKSAADRDDVATKRPAQRPVGKVADDENANQPGPAGPR
jgi:hypothetical protein